MSLNHVRPRERNGAQTSAAGRNETRHSRRGACKRRAGEDISQQTVLTPAPGRTPPPTTEALAPAEGTVQGVPCLFSWSSARGTAS